MASPTFSQLDAPSRRPRRWFFQISLRTLLILLMIVGVWLGVITKRARDQRAAVARILALGGYVKYDYQEAAQRARIANPTPRGWPWLRRAIGDDYFQTVVSVKLDSTKVTDDDLRLFGKLRQAHTLSFNFTTISDAGLAHLRDCRQARYLGLAETKVTNAGLAHVARMKQLESLNLQFAPVDDRGMKQLRGLSHLSDINVGGTKVTAKCVESLARLPSLRGLYLSRTALDDSALTHLVEAKQLRQVNLEGTCMSGEALLDLQDLRPDLEVFCHAADINHWTLGADEAGNELWQRIVIRLQLLNNERRLKLVDLSGSTITDDHLGQLHGLDHLDMIDLRDTRVTDEGVQALLAALPNCKVRR